MVKLVHHSVTNPKSWCRLSSGLLRASSYTTQSETLTSSPSSSPPKDTLYQRVLNLISSNVSPPKDTLYNKPISNTGSPPKDALYNRILSLKPSDESVIQILDQWVSEGNTVVYKDLKLIVKKLRTSRRRFKHALQIYEWISNSEHLDLSPRDFAVQLDLVSKVHGMKAADKYFETISDDFRTCRVYVAVLNCYADAKSIGKAEITMQKMRELGYANPRAYNVMMNLYAKMGDIEKLHSLLQEMEDRGISGDRISYNTRLSAYASIPDVKEMEKLLMKIEANPMLIGWDSYTIAAKGYIKAGDIEMASAALKKCEHLIEGKRARLANEMLLTLYASMGKKDDMYRIWEKYKRIGKYYNSSYRCMINGLKKLDDLNGAEKIFSEWEADNVLSDMKTPNCLIAAYCKKGNLAKAESIIEKLLVSGKVPNGSTWTFLALGYCEHYLMEQAVELMKKAILASRYGWKPDLPCLVSCVKYLRWKGDTEREEVLNRLLEERGLAEYQKKVEKYITVGNCGDQST